MQNTVKVSRFLFLFIALFTIITICDFDPVEAKTNEKLIYQKFLRKEYKKPYSGNGSYFKRGFYLINLDGKGVRELVLTRGEISRNVNGKFYVYSIKNKKVTKIGSFYDGSGSDFNHVTDCDFFEYNNKIKSIRSGTTKKFECYHFSRYKYKRSKLKAEFSCSNEFVFSRGKMKYVIDRDSNGLGGKIVNSERFSKYYEKHYSSIKWKKYYMKELTLNNINTL